MKWITVIPLHKSSLSVNGNSLDRQRHRRLAWEEIVFIDKDTGSLGLGRIGNMVLGEVRPHTRRNDKAGSFVCRMVSGNNCNSSSMVGDGELSM